MLKLLLSLFFKLSKVFFFFCVLLLSWTLALYLRSDIKAPAPSPTEKNWTDAKAKSRWFPRAEFGINNIFLEGTAFEQGLAWGSLTGDLLYRQEKNLVELYRELIPSRALQKMFEIFSIATFQGLESVLEKWMLDEMWGVSQSASPEFNGFASPFARQVAYHGIHEIGQLFVDLAPLGAACTFVSYPYRGNWFVGRTFDFEGGRIFDEEKVVKWVYPESGYKFVSVIWTGMVGAVSAVNEKGIYVSINAAGSSDVNVRGLPSTLLVSKVMREAATLEEALKIFRDTPSMITDIYMVLDSKANRLFKVEKSALRLDMTELKEAKAVANHLESAVFKDDEFNKVRREAYTSTYRQKRAQALLEDMKAKGQGSTAEVVATLVEILRDKGVDSDAKALHLGNRRAIDALIAAHGVVFDSKDRVLYVTQGPSMQGAFKAYDIERSFEEKRPVEKRGIGSDPSLSLEDYRTFKGKQLILKSVFQDLRSSRCAEASEKINNLDFEHVEFYYAKTLVEICLDKNEEAKKSAHKAMLLGPPHESLKTFFESVQMGDFK